LSIARHDGRAAALLLAAALWACQPAAAPAPLAAAPAPGVTAPPFPTLPPAWTATPRPSPVPNRTTAPGGGLLPTAGPRTWGPLVIGQSVEGRPLEVYRFGTGPRRRLLIAGIHGGYEWNTTALADEIIAHLSAQPDEVPAPVTLYVLRALNPDGAARGRGEDGRYNAHRVDLNRNFPVNWKYDFQRTGCRDQSPGDAGPRAASEPETRALMQFVLANPPEALISYHSAALGIFAGGQPPAEASLRLAETVDAASSYAYPPVATGCEYTGQLIDWAAAQGIAAIDLELHTHGSAEFADNRPVLAALLAWEK
jgi:predicted deacylase